MKYKRLGNSGLKVSELCFGTMNWGQLTAGGSTDEEARECFDTFVEAGGNFFDTANMYHNGHSERLLGEFIKDERDRYVIASKITFTPHPFHPTYPGDPNGAGNSRKNLRRELEADLKRLGTDYIDVLYLHCWDYSVPTIELMSTLNDFVREGKVHYLGTTNVPAYKVAEANMLARQHGWAEFIACEAQYNLISRGVEREILPMCKDFGLGITVYEALAAGMFCGDLDEINIRFNGINYDKITDAQWQLISEVDKIAKECGATIPQTAIAWVKSKGDNIVPIIGGRIKSHVVDNLKSLDISLDAEHIQRLDKLSNYALGFPQDMIITLNTWVYNHQFDNIDWGNTLPDFFNHERSRHYVIDNM